MSRAMLIPLSMIVAMPFAGCNTRVQPVAQQTIVNSNPIRPPDGPGELLVMPMTWRATGTDKGNGHWEGYLVVEHSPDGYLQNGYFEWHNVQCGGRYHFKGTYDPVTRRVRWNGYSVQDQIALPGMGNYEATLSEDGQRLENGVWSGPLCVPGTWSAEMLDTVSPPHAP